jgi:cAMP phosphodiesterase
VDLRVVGCHGGETPRHRTSAFVLDGRIAIDAGSLTSELDLPAQWRLEACLVSHAHLDHIRDLATIADNRAQHKCPPLVIAGTKMTLAILKKHFFNGLLWPDFTKIPNTATPSIVYQLLRPEEDSEVAGYSVKAIMVSHTIDCCAFVIRGKNGAMAYSGDTGPTERLWEVLNETKDLRAMLMEVSFPNREQKLATASGHHTPRTLAVELKKHHRWRELPFILYHIKPVFQAEVEKECAKIKGVTLTVPNLGDQFLI